MLGGGSDARAEVGNGRVHCRAPGDSGGWSNFHLMKYDSGVLGMG